ncbi:oligosaccharide flippase family protein [Neobacillus sp. 179-C4.2 HS]|uniref:Oligosaccharide flippase family protein n=1 Tax=Neobacillus driksii TaxID=3035913 RepID=A0ABV4YYW0_9BACI|nr:oligosaccharide flippase family protein [Neobacillus sp. 179.-C4.2 HS]MDP5194624.1 oligosaccharide flippase family protein [Neobacillus sp. 179.-C4.2 HS]
MNQLKAGAILSYLSILVNIIIALLYTPIVLRLLGQSEFGLYSLIGSIAGYLSILDLGLGNAIVRYTARNRALGDRNLESKLNGMFLVLYTFIGLLTVVIGILLYNYIESMFGATLTNIEIEKAKLMVIILIFNFAISFPLAVFGSIMQAYERFIAVKVITLVRYIILPIFSLPLLFIGYGSVSIVVITTIINILCLLYNVFYCFKHLRVKFHFGKIDYRLLLEVIGYSFFIFLNVIVDQIYWNTDQFVLGIVAGTAPVAVYAVAMQFVKLYMMFSTSISGVFLPKVSIMVANQSSSKELTDLLIKVGRIQYIIMALIISGFVLFGQPFIRLWAGKNYNDAYYIVLLVMIPLTIPLIQNVGISILQAKNLHGFRSIVMIVVAAVKIIISIPLASHFLGIGAAFATAVPLIIGNIIIMNIYYQRKIGLNMTLFWKNILLISVPVLISLGIGYGINYVFPSEEILFLFYKIVFFSICYIGLLWFLALNNYERQMFESTIQSFLKVAGKFKRLSKQ